MVRPNLIDSAYLDCMTVFPKLSFTRILLIINGIYTCVKLHFFFEITSILASTITKKIVNCPLLHLLTISTAEGKPSTKEKSIKKNQQITG